MNLVIDIGNTRIKAALFEAGQLTHFFVFEHPVIFGNIHNNPLIDLFNQHTIKHSVLASVTNETLALADALKHKSTLLIFTSQTPTPLKNQYKSISTLGSDRFAAAAGALNLFPNKNVLVIDAGTCIKYNFVNQRNEYIGGGISPGLRMRFKALQTFTAKLPLIDTAIDFDTLIGTTTEESILSGVELGSIAEINGIIEQYNMKYPDLTVILTGGDVNFFEKRLKKPIFTDSYLILKGLNAILEYNLNNAND